MDRDGPGPGDYHPGPGGPKDLRHVVPGAEAPLVGLEAAGALHGRVGAGDLEHEVVPKGVVVTGVPLELLVHAPAGVPVPGLEDLHDPGPGDVGADLLGRLDEDLRDGP